MYLIDLTHKIYDSMQVYPGDKSPSIQQTHFIEIDGYSNSQLTIGMHVGTHIDGPKHMLNDGQSISELSLDCFVHTACIVNIENLEELLHLDTFRKKISNCTAVLFFTGIGKYFDSKKYHEKSVELSENIVSILEESKIKMIGIDASSPDNEPYLIHKRLFSKGILIAENLTNLDKLLEYEQFELIALPMKLSTDSAPARVIAIVR